MNPQTTKLAPMYRTIAAVGGTGDGKSKSASLPAAPKARKIINRSVGETNSTLKERAIVYTEDFVNEMIIAAKIPTDIVGKQDFTEMITRALASVIRKKGGVDAFQIEPEDFMDELSSEITTKVNSRAILHFLPCELQSHIVESISGLLNEEKFFVKNCYEIYNTAKNKLNAEETKKNTKKFESAIRSEAEVALNLLSDNFEKGIDVVWDKINKALKSRFFDYFDDNNYSLDNYFYIRIDLDNQEQHHAIIDALFTPNKIRDGGQLSIEVLCSELVIYVPIEKNIAEILKEYGDVFINNRGKISIAMFDTRGLYHSDTSDDDNTDYLNDLLFTTDYDALMLVWPLSGDTNAEKLRELYVKAMAHYNKQLPVFVLHNKVDLFVGALCRELNADDDLFDTPITESENEIDIELIKNKVNSKIQILWEELNQAQHKSRKNHRIIALPCYLERDNTLMKSVQAEYHPFKSYRVMFNKIGNHLKDGASKIRCRIKPDQEIIIDVDKEQVKRLVLSRLHDSNVKKIVTVPGLNNLLGNLGKIPHGNGYNALRRRLKNGFSFKSDINEAYFYNCQSFNIDFPANLRNLITDEFVNQLCSTIEFQGGEFESADDAINLQRICFKYFSSLDFVANMTFEHAIKKAEEKWLFGFGPKFNEFLNICIVFFDKTRYDSDAYTVALVRTLEIAAEKAIAYHVLYR